MGSGALPVEAQVPVVRYVQRHPAVREACVLGLADPEWGEVVAAAVEADGTPDLLAWARDHLATHRRPRRVVFLSPLPRTPTGKVARAAVRLRLEEDR